MLSYEAVETRTQAFAEQLTELGVVAGDVVGVLLEHSVDFVIGVLATWLIGAVAAPLDPARSEHELYFQISDSEATVLLTADVMRAAVLGSGLHSVLASDMREAPRGAARTARTSATQYALRSYGPSSGEALDFLHTRRLPEGVMLDHAHLNALAATLAERAGMTARSRAIADRSAPSVHGLTATWLAALSVGGSTVFAGHPEHPGAPLELVDALTRHPADAIFTSEHGRRPAPYSAPLLEATSV